MTVLRRKAHLWTRSVICVPRLRTIDPAATRGCARSTDGALRKRLFDGYVRAAYSTVLRRKAHLWTRSVTCVLLRRRSMDPARSTDGALQKMTILRLRSCRLIDGSRHAHLWARSDVCASLTGSADRRFTGRGTSENMTSLERSGSASGTLLISTVPPMAYRSQPKGRCCCSTRRRHGEAPCAASKARQLSRAGKCTVIHQAFTVRHAHRCGNAEAVGIAHRWRRRRRQILLFDTVGIVVDLSDARVRRR